MRDFAIGIEDYYGWAHLVSVAVSGTDLTLMDKRRVELIDPHLTPHPMVACAGAIVALAEYPT